MWGIAYASVHPADSAMQHQARAGSPRPHPAGGTVGALAVMHRGSHRNNNNNSKNGGGGGGGGGVARSRSRGGGSDHRLLLTHESLHLLLDLARTPSHTISVSASAALACLLGGGTAVVAHALETGAADALFCLLQPPVPPRVRSNAVHGIIQCIRGGFAPLLIQEGAVMALIELVTAHVRVY